MNRCLLILVGLALLLASAVVHGLWTDRWRPSGDLARASDRLASLPGDLEEWKGQPYEQTPEALAISGAVSHYSRTFTDATTGDQVLVMLLAGKPARMAVHKPEDCYRAAGYELAGEPARVIITPPGEPGAEAWMGLFVRDDPAKGTSHLRIFWSWYAGGRWEAPDNPRWSFARRPVLYKLYVIRTVEGSSDPQSDPCVRLMGRLLPVLNKALAED